MRIRTYLSLAAVWLPTPLHIFLLMNVISMRAVFINEPPVCSISRYLKLVYCPIRTSNAQHVNSASIITRQT